MLPYGTDPLEHHSQQSQSLQRHNDPHHQTHFTTAHSGTTHGPIAYDTQRWVMSPTYSGGGLVTAPSTSTSSSAFAQNSQLLPANWTVRTCRACGDILAGPSISCELCHSTVHGHCATKRLGRVTCTACAAQLDFEYHQHRAQHILTTSSMRFGRFVQGAGALTGHALGAVATTTAAGAARLVAGVADGASTALHAARAIEFRAPTPSQQEPQTVENTPIRPRALEEYDINSLSEASQEAPSPHGTPELRELLAQVRGMQDKITEQAREIAELRKTSTSSASPAATPAQHTQPDYRTPSPEEFGKVGLRSTFRQIRRTRKGVRESLRPLRHRVRGPEHPAPRS